ncbi:hypothetical protein Sme01_22860 [Sphaerisporangium melleum]|uniref:Uncharacterized protein n=1 Tax=Sphaerisporangium melleum TaxID=321316 RepID=A0A917VGJ4_9ACTN|nr:DUF6082 family protein [Sphaerisporangium melleum]GGK78464.1 hypothetical protein GCM10007964_21510 [Sphaerisporangium melleum]GII69810.1 hypothetical protein Sme01_22860 [Sphaerisporangium melleum]
MTAQNPPRVPTFKFRPSSARHLVPFLTFALVLMAVGLVVLSPLALDALDDGGGWSRRSEIGQTYGAAAALISVFALAAITVSLVLQARETKLAREQASRTTHNELMTMALENDVYRECWGVFSAETDERTIRQQMYTNLIVSYWQTRFELGTFSETHLRHGASAIFSARPGRIFWRDARKARIRTSQTRKARRFHAILDEEYNKSVTATPVLGSPAKSRNARMAMALRRLAERLETP